MCPASGGRTELHREGCYYVEWCENGSRHRRSVGKNSIEAHAQQQRQIQLLRNKGLGISPNVDATFRILTHLPLRELWRSDGFATTARGTALTEEDVRKFLASGPVDLFSSSLSIWEQRRAGSTK